MRQLPAQIRYRCSTALSAAILLGLVLVTSIPPAALAADTTRPTLGHTRLTRSRFSPNADGVADSTAVRFWVSETARSTVRVVSIATGSTVRVLTAGIPMTAGYHAIVWDGRNTAGTVVPDGAYVMRLYISDLAGNRARLYPWPATARVDTVKPTFSRLYITPNPFSPNAKPDGYKDTSSVKTTLSEPGYADITIWGNGHTRRWRNLYRPAGTPGVVWNGRDSAGYRVNDGSYAVLVAYRDLAGNASVPATRATSIVVDTTPPTVTSLSVNVATPYVVDGVNDIAQMHYHVNERGSVTYSLRNPAAYRLRSGKVYYSAGSNILSWNCRQSWSTTTVVVPNGSYPQTMIFRDVAGNRRTMKKSYIVRSFYLVCVDPGHGGKNGVYDSGAVGPTGLRESVVNFDLAYNHLRPLLYAAKANGYPIKVLITRTKEYTPWMTLDRRSSLANRRGANIFVSVHCNAAASTVARGTETYSHSGVARSYRLASLIQQEALQHWSRVDRGVMVGPYYVLNHTRMPSALHEVEFISNPSKEKLLKQDSYRRRSATGLRDAIIRYFGVYP